jgi:hypothetical protein
VGAEFPWGNLRVREYLSLHGSNKNMDLQEIGRGGGGVHWIDRVQAGEKGRAIVKKACTFGFNTVQGNSSLAVELLARQDGLWFM